MLLFFEASMFHCQSTLTRENAEHLQPRISEYSQASRSGTKAHEFVMIIDFYILEFQAKDKTYSW